MALEIVEYQTDVRSLGRVSFGDSSPTKKPAVIVAHAWRGQDAFALKQAEELSKLGYVGFAADIFGNGTRANTDEEATKLMLPLFLNRALLRKRLLGAFETVAKLPQVDPNRIGAIGFCFGGLAVVELLRSGAFVKGVVSFHGVLSNQMGDQKAHLAANASRILGALLVLHGALDPMVSPQDILALQSEMTEAKVDWQINTYGKAAHAFTNPEVHNVKSGLFYEPKIAARSWSAMKLFFEEIFN